MFIFLFVSRILHGTSCKNKVKWNFNNKKTKSLLCWREKTNTVSQAGSFSLQFYSVYKWKVGKFHRQLENTDKKIDIFSKMQLHISSLDLCSKTSIDWNPKMESNQLCWLLYELVSCATAFNACITCTAHTDFRLR